MSVLREPNAEPLPGYRLIEPLGTGGFGEVWKCEAPGGLYKAIKFVLGNLNTMDAEASKAEQELKALSRIKEVRHPFVLSTERIEVIGGELIIVMELADKSLHDYYIECQGAGLRGIPRDALLRFIRDAAEALDHMIEKHNLQHLDIKPRNLFLISDRVKVADFGMVKNLERQSGSLAGATPLYAPPETFLGKISPHSDQYSLAIVYVELLTGQRPFSGKNPRQVAMQHMQGEPELRPLPEADRVVVARALSKDPAKRFPNCLAFVRALYMAQVAANHGLPSLETEGGDSGNRPKTLAETMEDFLLEQVPEETSSPRFSGEVQDEVSELGLTIHQPETGVLRPTLILGLGSFGRRTLLELRCRILDRFGALAKVPLFHFLYIDSDPEAVRSAVHGSPEVAFGSHEVYHLPLQPMGNYRRRMLDHLNEWLPREKLYSMPRSLQTQGSRALGRLAFLDNHLRLLSRLRREVGQVMHPDALYHSVSETGLALQNNRPRVYVIAAAGGGSSGLVVDLGYSLRRLLQQLRQTEADVISFLFCGAPEDPATPRPEQANVYATLTELNHFTSSDIQFAAQYGADGPRLVDRGPPFNSTYLLKFVHRNPEGHRDAVAHLGSYLFHELTTPLGLRLDIARQEMPADNATLFRSFGTHAVWFPRGLLLRLAGQGACIRLLQDWQRSGEPAAPAEVEAVCARALTDPQLQFEALCNRIEEAASADEGNLANLLTTLLFQIDEQSQQFIAQDDPASWSQQAFKRLEEWLGSDSGFRQENEWRKSRLGRALTSGIQKVAGEWESRLVGAASRLMEFPGHRVAAAEAALTRFMGYCQETAAAQQNRLDLLHNKTQHAAGQVARALEQCQGSGGGFSFFGSRSRRSLRLFVDHLAAYSRQRLAEELALAGQQFFTYLEKRLGERLQDLSFCRQRLRYLQENLEEPGLEGSEDSTPFRLDSENTPNHSPLPSTEAYWEIIRQSQTVRVVMPDGEEDLNKSAARFLNTLTQEQWTQLDQALQDRVLAGIGGLHKICMTGADLARKLSMPLVTQAANCLGELLPITDVAQAEFSIASPNGSVAARVENYYARATPLVNGNTADNQSSFLLVPASDAGKSFGDEATKAVPSLQLVPVPGQADLMFCREQGYLTNEDIQRILRPCRHTYEQAAPLPSTSPHARFDILDWVPIDP